MSAPDEQDFGNNPLSHKIFEPYSAGKPVPRISLKNILKPSEATEAKARRLAGKNEQKKEHAQVAKYIKKGEEAAVKDPVTGEETTVKHAKMDDSPDTRSENILQMELPSPDWEGYRQQLLSVARSHFMKVILGYTVWPLLVYTLLPLPTKSHPHISSMIRLISSIVPPTLFALTLWSSFQAQSAEEFDRQVWHSERRRGMAAGRDTDEDGKVEVKERTKESAEWLNALISTVWAIINPDLFASSVDMLEDIMQASVPKFVHSIRVVDLGLGSNPMRITSIRSLPDESADRSLQGVDKSIREHLEREHLNLEVSFMYRALPSGKTAHSKAHNVHLLIEFFLGLRGVWNFSIPIWVELTGVTGTARMKMEMIPAPPFVKTTLVTFMGLPEVSLAVVPLAKELPNVMNLPVISTFIARSIDAACAEYVAPRSMTLDLQQLIQGDDIKKDTEAMGVVIVNIHRANGIKKADAGGGSDAYVTVCYARQGKPLFSTRIIKSDLNPCWEETTAVVVDANAIKIGEKLRMQLWDSDRASADDMLGFVDVDLLELLRNQNTPRRLRTYLTSPDSRERPGMLEFTVGFFAKVAPNHDLTTDGSDPSIPEDLKQTHPELRNAKQTALNDLETAVLVTPPDKAWPSGILSVQIHEIRGLQVQMQGKEKKPKEGEKGQDDDAEEQEESEGLPSSYCTIALNDEMIYSTRVKPITATPTFNAGTERFIRDWRTTHVSVVVRDSRTRENDPILGMVFLKLSDLLVNSSEVTRFYPLENGIGFGSARISVLFRPVVASLPPQLLGFETGALLIRSVRAKTEHADEFGKCAIKLSTSAGSSKISRRAARKEDDGWQSWGMENEDVELPVNKRYSSSLVLSIDDATGLRRDTEAMAVLWLRDVVDNDDAKISLALWKTEDHQRLRQNYLPLNGDLSGWEGADEKMERIGTLEVDLTFRSGITDAHKKNMNSSDDTARKMWDAVERRDAAGLSEKVGRDSSASNGVPQEDNTEVDEAQVEVHEPEEAQSQHGEGGGSSDSDSNEGSGLMKKLKDWKRHQHELNQQHRGVMQAKPMRMAKWIKDDVEQAGHKLADRFSMKSREPDIETET